MEPITVLIADDPSLLRAGLVSMLEAEHDIKVVGLASEIIEAADKAHELKPQVILSDVRLKGYDSLKSMLEIRESLPSTAIVILTESEREDDVFRAFAYGAQGYLLKSCSKSDLVRAVKKAASGEMMLSEPIASRLVKELHDRASLPRFSKREAEVLRLLGEGLTNREIADRLIVSESTVRTYIYRLGDKLGLKSRFEIGIWSRRHLSIAGNIEGSAVPEMRPQTTEKREPLSVPGEGASRSAFAGVQSGQNVDKQSGVSTAMVAERKLTTVVAIDLELAGDTSKMAEAEKAEEFLHECLDLIAKEIKRYDGTVLWFTSRGIRSLFGAPLSLEYAPQTALHVALAIRDSMKTYSQRFSSFGIQIYTRIGVNSGLVQVEKHADSLASRFIPLGDTVELATHVKDMGERNSILVSENTYRLTRSHFSFAPLGEVISNGRMQPVNAYRLTGLGPAKTRLQAAEQRGLTRFVGRRKELSTMKEALQKARSGVGQLVGIVGEAGVGKSRLVLEFRKILSPEVSCYLEGSCIHYGEATPYLPFLRAMRSYFDIREAETDSDICAKLKAIMQGISEDLSQSFSPLCDMMSLPVKDEIYLKLEPAQRRERIFEAIRDILLTESKSKSIVLVIDDYQWVDRTSEDLLSYLIDLLENAPILLIFLYRPEYTHPWANRSVYTQIRLHELSPNNSVELSQSILGAGVAVPDLQKLIIDQAGGNPLFIEEFVHDLWEGGAIRKEGKQYILTRKLLDIEVPFSIYGIIASRIDRLDDNSRVVMQAASVIGREFIGKILELVVGMRGELKPCLLSLQRLDFIYQRSLSPQPEYSFKHALTQEVVYNSLPLRQRKRLHERIAEVIREQYPDILDEFSEVLAHHYSKSDNHEKACEYFILSGDKAARKYANWEAYSFYGEATKMLNRQADNVDTRRRKLGVCLAAQSAMRSLAYPEDSLKMLEEAESIANEFDDKRSRAIICSSMGLYYTFHGDNIKGTEYAEQCLEQAEKIEDIDILGPVAFNVCSSYSAAGRHIKLIEVAPKILALLEKKGRESDNFGSPFNLYTAILAYYALGLGLLGDFMQAENLCHRAISTARIMGNPYNMAVAETLNGFICLDKGDGEAALMHVQNAIRHAEEAGIVPLSAVNWMQLGHSYYLTGKLEEAMSHLEKAVKIYSEVAVSMQLSQCYYCMGLVHFENGDMTNGLKYAKDALALAEKNDEKIISADSKVLLGRILAKVKESKYGDAEKSILEGIKDLESLKVRPKCAQGHLFLGELHADAGRKDKALRQFREAQTMFQEMGMDYWLLKTQKLLKKLE